MEIKNTTKFNCINDGHFTKVDSKFTIGFESDSNFNSAENIFELLFQTTCKYVLTESELEIFERLNVADTNNVKDMYKNTLESMSPNGENFKVWYVGELLNYYTMTCPSCFDYEIYKSRMLNREPNDGIPKGIDGLFYLVDENDTITYVLSEVKFYNNDRVKEAIIDLFEDLEKRLRGDEKIVFKNSHRPPSFPQGEYDEIALNHHKIPHSKQIVVMLNVVTCYDEEEFGLDYYDSFKDYVKEIFNKQAVKNRYTNNIINSIDSSYYNNIEINFTFTSIGLRKNELKSELFTIFSGEGD